jgi:N utilization substance protein A
MNNIEIIESFSDLKNESFIDRPNLITILKEVLDHAIRKQFGEDIDFDIIINGDNGDIEIWRNYQVVEDGDLVNKNLEISVSNIEDEFEVGEEYSIEIKISELDRRTILVIKQNLQSKIKDFKNKLLIEQFNDLVNEIYIANVHSIRRDSVILIDGDGNEISLPKKNQIPGDFFKSGESVRGVIESVSLESGKPKIIMSRTSDYFLEKLLEIEIPEIMDGLITIHQVKRIPGNRAKVVVESYDDRIDPVGACVGTKGSKIMSLVKELNNEFIDIINFTENKQLLITRAINPAKPIAVSIDELNKKVSLELNSEDISKAIGKAGANIKLASMITGFDIEINKSSETNTEDDVDINDFSDEIDQWIINEFIKVGLETAKSILKYTPEVLSRVTDLEEETIDEVISILKSEFE